MLEHESCARRRAMRVFGGNCLPRAWEADEEDAMKSWLGDGRDGRAGAVAVFGNIKSINLNLQNVPVVFLCSYS